MPLTQTEIDALLAKPRRGGSGRSTPPQESRRYPRVKHIGVYKRLTASALTCMSRGCGSTAHAEIEGIAYCTVHALQKMNYIILSRLYLDLSLESCTCKSGHYSFFTDHHYECPLYPHDDESREFLAEQRRREEINVG